MNEGITIIVGTGEGGQQAIGHALRERGYRVRYTHTRWPRDTYVEHAGRITDGVHNPYGEGGNVLSGNDYLIISDLCDRSAYQPRRALPYSIIREHTLQCARTHYPRTRIHVAPSGAYHFGDGEAHIDLFALLLPRTGVLLLDDHFGGAGARAREWDDLADQEGLRVEHYTATVDGTWYPLNALVLDTGEGELVLINRSARDLSRRLKRLGVEPILIDMPVHEPAGGIHCQTNTLTRRHPHEKHTRNP